MESAQRPLVAVSCQRYACQAKVERKQAAMANGSHLQAERKRFNSDFLFGNVTTVTDSLLK
jgi:hypothetical protein